MPRDASQFGRAQNVVAKRFALQTCPKSNPASVGLIVYARAGDGFGAIVKFDVILTNPPFQDSVNRKKTPHKLWIEFTLSVFDRLLKEGGSLVQVSPMSFASPSNKVLNLMTSNRTRTLRVGTEAHFPGIGSSFSDYWIEKAPPLNETLVVTPTEQFAVKIDSRTQYLPNDLSELSLSIHSKVMFGHHERLSVEWDYVGAHNIRRFDASPSLVEVADAEHPFPVFHTNRSIWWSSVRQEWADLPKVMWTRSGYTKPFFDNGVHGGTDMVYFVRSVNSNEGTLLAGTLNSALFQYIFRTARWSGFGNERVFTNLPVVPAQKPLTDSQIYRFFRLTREEVNYVQESLAPRRGKNQ